DRYRCDRQRSPRGYHDRRGPPGRVCRATRARVLPPPTAGRSRSNGLRDGQHDLLRDAPIASLLPDAHQRGELVGERIDVLDAGGLTALERRETLLAPIADAAPADGVAVLRLAGIDNAGVGITAGRALHHHKIWDELPLNLVLGGPGAGVRT